MAFDETLAQRVRQAMPNIGTSERKMFGGLCFMYNGHMCCGVQDDELMVRVGPDAYEEALAQPHAREMDFTGKPLRGMLYIGSTGIADELDLQSWVERGLAFTRELPAKKPKAKKKRA